MNDLLWLNQLFPASITHTCHFHKNDENIIMDSTKIESVNACRYLTTRYENRLCLLRKLIFKENNDLDDRSEVNILSNVRINI
jgi:hypothetical protein